MQDPLPFPQPREALLQQIDALRASLAALDAQEPQDMTCTQYQRWGERHEALEDALDDLLDQLED